MKIMAQKRSTSPTEHTIYGPALLEKDPEAPGLLGIAISEAVEITATSDGRKKS